MPHTVPQTNIVFSSNLVEKYEFQAKLHTKKDMIRESWQHMFSISLLHQNNLTSLALS